MAVIKSAFGTGRNGEKIHLYTIKNKNGMEVVLSNLGAAVVKLLVPDKDGNLADIVLGFDKAEAYYGDSGCFGVVVGPSANRIGGASFEIDGQRYTVDNGDGGNNLHSHPNKAYQKRVWDAVEVSDNSVRFHIEDNDGEMGFPGNKKVDVTYTLDDENALTLHYHGTSDKKTILNLTNHSYFNLDGHDSGSIEEHELWMDASFFTPAKKSIPTGEIAAVAGTPMDFTKAKKIGRDIDADYEQLTDAGGFDHNWVINEYDGTLKHFATVRGSKSGRAMKVSTTLPGVQLYVGNYIEPQQGKDGVQYNKRGGLCLETQFFPDSIHHENFPSCIFGGEGGREYDSETVFRFE